MLRPILAAVLGAAFGAVAIEPLRERVADQLWQPAEAIAVGLAALAAGLIAAFVMACREPRPGTSPDAWDNDHLLPLFVGGHRPTMREGETPLDYAERTGDYRAVERYRRMEAMGGPGVKPTRDAAGRFKAKQ